MGTHMYPHITTQTPITPLKWAWLPHILEANISIILWRLTRPLICSAQNMSMPTNRPLTLQTLAFINVCREYLKKNFFLKKYIGLKKHGEECYKYKWLK